MKVVMVIPYSDTSKYRRRNHFMCLEHYRQIFDDIVVVQFNGSEAFLGCDNLYLEGSFNRSLAFNTAAIHYEADAFFYCDSDIIIEDDNIYGALSKLSEYLAVKPYSKVAYLSEKEAETFNIEVSYLEENSINSFCGGAVMLKRELILAVKGWESRMHGWGAEDNLMNDVLNAFYKDKILRMDGVALHLYHELACPRRKGGVYRNNVRLLREARRMGMKKYIEQKENLI